jgi:hypothetical protein
VRRYFQDATLPDPGTECEQDYGLFETLADGGEDGLLAQEDELSSAVREFSRKAVIGFGGRMARW